MQEHFHQDLDQTSQRCSRKASSRYQEILRRPENFRRPEILPHPEIRQEILHLEQRKRCEDTGPDQSCGEISGGTFQTREDVSISGILCMKFVDGEAGMPFKQIT